MTMDVSRPYARGKGGIYDGSKQPSFNKARRECENELRRRAAALKREVRSTEPPVEVVNTSAPTRAGPWSHLRSLTPSSVAVVQQHAGKLFSTEEEHAAQKEAAEKATSMRRDAIVAAPRWRAVAVVHHSSATGNHIASAIPSDPRALEALAAARIGIWAPGPASVAGAGRTRVGAAGGAQYRSGMTQREQPWQQRPPPGGYRCVIGAERDGIVLVRPWWEGGGDAERESASLEVQSMKRWITPPSTMVAMQPRKRSGMRKTFGATTAEPGWSTLPWGRRSSELLQDAQHDQNAPRTGAFAWRAWK